MEKKKFSHHDMTCHLLHTLNTSCLLRSTENMRKQSRVNLGLLYWNVRLIFAFLSVKLAILRAVVQCQGRISRLSFSAVVHCVEYAPLDVGGKKVFALLHMHEPSSFTREKSLYPHQEICS